MEDRLGLHIFVKFLALKTFSLWTFICLEVYFLPMPPGLELISQRLLHTMFLELCNLFSEENKFWSFVKYMLWSFCMERNGAFLAKCPKLNVFHINVVITSSLIVIRFHMLQYVVSYCTMYIEPLTTHLTP